MANRKGLDMILQILGGWLLGVLTGCPFAYALGYYNGGRDTEKDEW